MLFWHPSPGCDDVFSAHLQGIFSSVCPPLHSVITLLTAVSSSILTFSKLFRCINWASLASRHRPAWLNSCKSSHGESKWNAYSHHQNICQGESKILNRKLRDSLDSFTCSWASQITITPFSINNYSSVINLYCAPRLTIFRMILSTRMVKFSLKRKRKPAIIGAHSFAF